MYIYIYYIRHMMSICSSNAPYIYIYIYIYINQPDSAGFRDIPSAAGRGRIWDAGGRAIGRAVGRSHMTLPLSS